MTMMDRAMHDLDRAKGRMAADFRTMINDSEELLKAAASVSGEGFGAARTKFAERVKSAKAMLADALQPDYIRGNPWTAVGMAVAAGLLIGLLAGKR
jgi:ElaB/YqjD/DUF883 family membrane-anchored ribosome-binding protein